MSMMMASGETALRGFYARILGWSTKRKQVIAHALRSIQLSITHHAALVLLGDTDLVAIASALHRRTIGVGLGMSHRGLLRWFERRRGKVSP
jgi:hypothetical protein